MTIEGTAPKPRRKGFHVIALVLIAFCTAAYFAGFQRNPAIAYYSTDGMAMVRELDLQLANREGFRFYFRGMRLDSMPTPANYSGAGYSPNEGISGQAIIVIRYKQVLFGREVRNLARRFHVSLPMPSQQVQYVDFQALVGPLPYPRGWRTSETPPQLTPEEEDKFAKGQALINAALTLEDNGHLRLHSDFVVVQHGLQVRVYSMNALPQPVRELLDACGKQITARETFIAND